MAAWRNWVKSAWDQQVGIDRSRVVSHVSATSRESDCESYDYIIHV